MSSFLHGFSREKICHQCFFFDKKSVRTVFMSFYVRGWECRKLTRVSYKQPGLDKKIFVHVQIFGAQGCVCVFLC